MSSCRDTLPWLISFSLDVWTRMKASVTELPFNSFLGIQNASDPSQLLRLPSGEQYLNHLGSVHASAQLALAEATSGEFLLRHFGTADGIIPVVRRLEAKFLKPAKGSITSTASATPEALATARFRARIEGPFTDPSHS
jgi:acyl-coenzyme A thioesterase PaaI-like protein